MSLLSLQGIWEGRKDSFSQLAISCEDSGDEIPHFNSGDQLAVTVDGSSYPEHPLTASSTSLNDTSIFHTFYNREEGRLTIFTKHFSTFW